MDEAPAPAPEPEVLPPPPTGLEVDTSESILGALQPFLEATAAGHRGIAIVRELPERIRAHVGPRPVEVLWLSNIGRGPTVRPTDLAGIHERVRTAFADAGVSAVFLEGIEYLVRIHGIDRVVDLLTGLDEEARQYGARVWVHVTPALLSPAELARLVAGASDSGTAPAEEPPAGNDIR